MTRAGTCVNFANGMRMVEVVFLDTNILIATVDPQDLHHERTVAFMQSVSRNPLSLSPPVYAEVSVGMGSEAVLAFLEEWRIRPSFAAMDTPALWELAAERFARYRANHKRSGGDAPRRILTDFLIGAHAVLAPGTGYAATLATLDRDFFTQYFPELKVLVP